MKKCLTVCGIFLIFALSSFTVGAAKIDDVEVTSFVKNGTTMAKASELADALSLDFTVSDGVYRLKKQDGGEQALHFQEGRGDAALIDAYPSETAADEIPLEEPWAVVNGALYVPFRPIAEFFGARVYWTPEEGAFAQRTDYGHPVLIRTDGTDRTVLTMPDGFETALIAGDNLIYLVDDSFYIRPLSGGEASRLCAAGKTHLTDDRLFVSSGGRVGCVNLQTLSYVPLFEGAVMVGYTADDCVWCESAEGDAFVFDGDGTCLAHVTVDFDEAFDYYDGFVYYLKDALTLYRARPDGSDSCRLAKSAAYPALIDGGVYYTDLAGNFRRVDVETGDDFMVYGLNLECMGRLDGQTFLFNFYAPSLDACRLFAAAFDGSLFHALGPTGLVLDRGLKPFRDGVCARSLVDAKLYYITADGAHALSDDEADVFCGVNGDFAYYIVS